MYKTLLDTINIKSTIRNGNNTKVHDTRLYPALQTICNNQVQNNTYDVFITKRIILLEASHE